MHDHLDPPRRLTGSRASHLRRGLAAALAAGALVGLQVGLVTSPAQAAGKGAAHQGAYVQTDLVSDVPGRAQVTDPNLVNPWGVSFGPATPLWTANEGTATSTLYRGGAPGMPAAAVPLVVPTPPHSTGTVFNPTADAFALPDGTVSRFLFDDLGGSISAWAPGKPAATPVVTVPGASFTGLSVAVTEAGPRLYAADAAGNVVRVFDGSFRQVGELRSSGLPAGLSVYNVHVLGDSIYVTYAPPPGVESSVGGAIDLFKADGRFLRHLVIGGPLDGPWGLAIAPRHWGPFARDLLVGNEDSGQINAFNPRTGSYDGTVADASGMPITNDGLWGIAFGNGVIATPDTLIVAAGIDEYQHGLVAAITPTRVRAAD
ncbi:uncharacterized protein (TIGR03118 family) [Motilibacter peucedani]|uniref:Uncharacterized protein (TIGR03118 family) n=1 Tax=Motilibacter peucedani TaxID=598650 RepID=A0A420XRU3_9ACTN|nr:TIGR03118 family protein [Motilibacter peucedani]RKS77605.1 uncharacterized protein (TIGR03118 family) [Motilibacter peucedani]